MVFFASARSSGVSAFFFPHLQYSKRAGGGGGDKRKRDERDEKKYTKVEMRRVKKGAMSLSLFVLSKDRVQGMKCS